MYRIPHSWEIFNVIKSLTPPVSIPNCCFLRIACAFLTVVWGKIAIIDTETKFEQFIMAKHHQPKEIPITTLMTGRN